MDQLVPLSNQMSIVSVPRRYCSPVALRLGETHTSSGISGSNHAFVPFSRMTEMICSTFSDVRIGWPEAILYSAGIGTPHARCREIHHSLRLCTNDVNRAVASHGQKDLVHNKQGRKHTRIGNHIRVLNSFDGIPP